MTDKNLTPASHWRESYDYGIEVELPNGEIVMMRTTIDVTYLIGTGQIPDGLTAIALEGLNIESGDKKAVASLSEGIKRLNELYKIVCMATWIQPRVVDKNPGENEILFDWLTPEQKDYTWRLINHPVSEWTRFLSLSRTGLESVSNGAVEPAVTKSTVARKRVG
jgi:hypothetical protein